MTTQLTRRKLVHGAAWSVPVIAVAAHAPAFAASTDPITGLIQASKCPGKSTKEPDTVIVSFTSSYTLTGFTKDNVTSLTVNGADIPVQRVTVESGIIRVVTIPRENSADASGMLVINYTFGGQTFVGEFPYDGTHPNHDLCERI